MKTPIETQVDVLLVGNKSWLQFYDSLPSQNRQDTVFSIVITDDAVRYYGYSINRKFYLARVAEALLPSRYSRNELRALETVLYNNMHAGSNPELDPSSFVSRLYKVMLAK